MSDATDPSPVDYYIYYRVRDLAEAVPRVHAMQAELAAITGIGGRLMRRRDEDETLMEIYPGVIYLAAFDAALDDLVAAHSIGSFVVEGTARHTERFLCA